VSAAAAAYPPVADLLPHAGDWVLLSRVLKHDAVQTRCGAVAAPRAWLNMTDGSLPEVIGLEYMAQCVAVHGGLRSRDAGEPRRLGLLLGARRVEVHTTGFPVGQSLEIVAQHVWGDRGLFVFACSIHDAASGAVLMTADLNVLRMLGDGRPDPWWNQEVPA